VGKNKNAEKREREKDSRETQSAFKGALQKPALEFSAQILPELSG
jgi:hypothetical protein